jgi:hypothetical protein
MTSFATVAAAQPSADNQPSITIVSAARKQARLTLFEDVLAGELPVGLRMVRLLCECGVYPRRLGSGWLSPMLV